MAYPEIIRIDSDNLVRQIVLKGGYIKPVEDSDAFLFRNPNLRRNGYTEFLEVTASTQVKGRGIDTDSFGNVLAEPVGYIATYLALNPSTKRVLPFGKQSYRTVGGNIDERRILLPLRTTYTQRLTGNTDMTEGVEYNITLHFPPVRVYRRPV